MRLALITVLMAWLTIQMVAFADSVVTPPPRAWAITSEDGSCFITMVPSRTYGTFRRSGTAEEWRTAIAEREQVSEPKAFAVAYRITVGGRFEELWRAKGWLGAGFLSNGGRYFVRMRYRGSRKKDLTDLAVAFYDRGNLLKEYQVKELIKKPELLEHTVSSYTWLPKTQTKPNGFDDYGTGNFHLVMIDKTTYGFDYKTGEIVSTGRDDGAKSDREVRAEYWAQDEKKGKAMFEASPIYEDYSRHFEASDFGTRSGGSVGLWRTRTKGLKWNAKLTPKKRFTHNTYAEPVFSYRDEKLVKVSVTAAQVLAVLERGFQHPYIDKLFKDCGASDLKVYFREDRLHLDSERLAGYVEKVTGTRPKEAELRHWACFYINIDIPDWVDPNKLNRSLAHQETPEFAAFVETIIVKEPNQIALERWARSLSIFSSAPSPGLFLWLHLNPQTGEIISDTGDVWYEDIPYLIDATGKRVTQTSR